MYFVKFPDGGLYATGQQEVPGGPIAYELPGDAQKVAEAIDGVVVERTLDHALAFCLSKGFTLWIKKARGGMAYVQETVSEQPGETVRVEGAERRAAIEASRHLAGG